MGNLILQGTGLIASFFSRSEERTIANNFDTTLHHHFLLRLSWISLVPPGSIIGAAMGWRDHILSYWSLGRWHKRRRARCSYGCSRREKGVALIKERRAYGTGQWQLEPSCCMSCVPHSGEVEYSRHEMTIILKTHIALSQRPRSLLVFPVRCRIFIGKPPVSSFGTVRRRPGLSGYYYLGLEF